ncbi:MAG: STAS/SEC14 domain-containing protein [Nitriliruptoraceae bacterium]
MEEETVRGTRFEMLRDRRGFLRCSWAVGTEVGREDAQQAVAAVATLAPTLPYPLLVDMRRVRRIDHEARRVFGTNTVLRRQALLIETPVSRVLANFFISVTGTAFPTRSFDDEAKAIDWLQREE